MARIKNPLTVIKQAGGDSSCTETDNAAGGVTVDVGTASGGTVWLDYGLSESVVRVGTWEEYGVGVYEIPANSILELETSETYTYTGLICLSRGGGIDILSVGTGDCSIY